MHVTACTRLTQVSFDQGAKPGFGSATTIPSSSGTDVRSASLTLDTLQVNSTLKIVGARQRPYREIPEFRAHIPLKGLSRLG